MTLIALRGAITVTADDPALVGEATQELLGTLLARNGLQVAQVISACFTCTGDLEDAAP